MIKESDTEKTISIGQVYAPADGKGLWSSAIRRIYLTFMQVTYVSKDEEFGELRVFFMPETWDISADGLIYTDPRFERDVKLILKAYGFSPRAYDHISYSEQGMQGVDFVSFDVNGTFIAEFFKKAR